MKAKNISDEPIDIYLFPDYAPEIYSDLKGKFYQMENDKPLKKIISNGSLCVTVGQKKYYLKKLRRFAKKSKKVIEKLPF
jgi:hypothetical protein